MSRELRGASPMFGVRGSEERVKVMLSHQRKEERRQRIRRGLLKVASALVLGTAVVNELYTANDIAVTATQIPWSADQTHAEGTNSFITKITIPPHNSVEGHAVKDTVLGALEFGLILGGGTLYERSNKRRSGSSRRRRT